MQKGNKTLKQKSREKFYEELVKAVKADFTERQQARKSFERQWELNMNFLVGNQYCGIDVRGDIVKENKDFFWQERGVYNHIAPIIETRIAKFAEINPVFGIRPKTDDDADVKGANLAEKLLTSAFDKQNVTDVVNRVTVWSETCGTGFYKIVWNNAGGTAVGSVNGEEVFEGEAEILPVSPFEIFPDNLTAENIDELGSIIHAKAVPVSEIKRKYGVNLQGEKVSVFEALLQARTDAISGDTHELAFPSTDDFKMEDASYGLGRFSQIDITAEPEDGTDAEETEDNEENG